MQIVKNLSAGFILLAVLLLAGIPAAMSQRRQGINSSAESPAIRARASLPVYLLAQNNRRYGNGDNRGHRWERWKSLSPAEKDLLRRRYRQWKKLPPGKRKKLLSIYRTLKRMPPEERRELIPLIRRWHSLTPEQRGYVLKKLREYGFDNSPESI